MKRVFVENMRDKSERYSSDVPRDLTVGELREALGGDRVKIVCRGRVLENNEKKLLEEVPEGDGEVLIHFVPPVEQPNVVDNVPGEFGLDMEELEEQRNVRKELIVLGMFYSVSLVIAFFKSETWMDFLVEVVATVLVFAIVMLYPLFWRLMKYLFPAVFNRREWLEERHRRKERDNQRRGVVEVLEPVTSENAEKGGLVNIHGEKTVRKPFGNMFLCYVYVCVRCFFAMFRPSFDLDMFADRYPWLPRNRENLRKTEERRRREAEEEQLRDEALMNEQ